MDCYLESCTGWLMVLKVFPVDLVNCGEVAYVLKLIINLECTVPEFKDPVFAKTSPKRSFSMTENERFGLVFRKTGSINSGTGDFFQHIKNSCPRPTKFTHLIWLFNATGFFILPTLMWPSCHLGKKVVKPFSVHFMHIPEVSVPCPWK